MVLSEQALDEILEYLNKSITKLAQDTINNSEFQMEVQNLKDFLSSQYEIRLDNLLQRKNSNIHHLESGLKNKVIQKKRFLLDTIIKNLKP